MNPLKNEILKSESFVRLTGEAAGLKTGIPLNVHGINGSLLAFIAVHLFEHFKRQVVLISSEEDKAEKLRDDCAMLAGEHNVRYFGASPVHEAKALDVAASISRIETLDALSAGNKYVVVTFPGSIVEKVPSRDRFNDRIIRLEKGSEYDFQDLIRQIEKNDFERKNFVESYGDFAVRGGIIDVFPYVGENPVRIEFWGDTLESIREFDLLSQRSIQELKKANIVPKLASGETINTESSLLDYLDEDAMLILDEPDLFKGEIEELQNEGIENIFKFGEIRSSLSERLIVNISQFKLPAEPEMDPAPGIDFSSVPQPAVNGSVKVLIDQVAKFTKDGYKIYITSDTKDEMKRLQELIDETFGIPENGPKGTRPEISEPGPSSSGIILDAHPVFLHKTIHSGFVYHPSKIAVFTEHEIFNRLKRRGTRKIRRFKGFSQKEIRQLKRGDFVVHVDHGIGEFAGLTKIKVGNVEEEVMKILFLENDTLYVNLNFVNSVQKYSSQEGHVPKLTRLGAPDWDRMKQKVKGRIKDIARDLIALYAKRKNETGTAFSPDSHWQKELEASFIYEDTLDQATATRDVKNDMEKSSPMDRLICGDVGFGKTEVAVRAAFKAVMDNKQVAILVPTTILAVQHYNTFLDRLHNYVVRIENLTRFKSKKDQTQIVEELKKGSVDIVIGTHRLLSKDIGFKDLGLLIIDEEHRFGVSAKEKLRQLKANVDTLALTATPIPRTLHFSLIGSRDLSLINTPPRNRLPIITEMIPSSDGRQTQWRIVREAILKELHRGGQIYFVHDRVNDINAIADRIKSSVPESRVHVAHGQMTGHQLEKTMLDFLEKKYDVLVATKIIESGLDIPNVNTIIINRADRFGLAELYQLRGRVGRSNIQAYAYLLVPPLNLVPKNTLRRLSAIEEFTELGSGFSLAMRDLEIRGAGNLLGSEQSGFILEMGMEMYERILREAVEELKHDEFKSVFADKADARQASPKSESIIDADIVALIPDFYIGSDTERLDLYRRLYRAADEKELLAMRDELKDRFGEYPEEVENLIRVVEVRMAASAAGLQRVALNNDIITITLPDEADKQFYGSDESEDTPFQRLLGSIRSEKNVSFKHAGKKLQLIITEMPDGKPFEKLENAKNRLKTIFNLPD